MNEVKVICPKCGNRVTYKNWVAWIWHTPFHWFGKRRTKCTKCGEVSYIGRDRSNKQYFTPSEVRQMHPNAVRENYQSIKDSMEKWK